MAAFASAEERVVRFSGLAEAGREFTYDAGDGLEFALAPTGTGWNIVIRPRGSSDTACTDFVWVVMPPYRTYNARYLDSSYGFSAREAAEWSPRDFKFVLNCRDYKIEQRWVLRVLGSGEASEEKIAEASAKIGSSPQGTGTLWVDDFKVSPSGELIQGIDYGKIDWIRFRAELHIPDYARIQPEQSEPPEEPDPRPRTSVTGVIRDYFTKAPVKGAVVRLAEQKETPITTGADGRFRFPDIPEGEIDILAEAPGYFPIDRLTLVPYSPSPSRYRITRGATELSLELQPECRIRGVVTSDDGRPLSGIRVQLRRLSLQNGRKIQNGPVDITTDAAGVYSFEKLVPDDFHVQTLLHPAGRDTGYPAARVSLKLDSRMTQADFRLVAAPVFRVSGKVTDALVPDSFSCEAWGEEGQQSGQSADYDAAMKIFRMVLPEGRWKLWCNGWQDGPHTEGIHDVHVKDADVSGIRFQTYPTVDIRVTRGETDDPLNVLVVDGRWLTGRTLFEQDGAIREVGAGRYRVRISPEMCVGSLKSGNLDLTRDDVNTAQGPAPAPIVLTQNPDCHSVSGFVRSEGSDNPRGTVLVLPESDRVEPLLIPFAKGRFSTRPLTPGTYYVFAFTSLNDLEYGNLSVMRHFPHRIVQVDRNSPADSLTLDLIERR